MLIGEDGSWALGDVVSKPRKLNNNDVLDGKRVRLSGSNKNQVVVEVFVYARVEHAQELGGAVAAAAAAPAARRVAR